MNKDKWISIDQAKQNGLREITQEEIRNLRPRTMDDLEGGFEFSFPYQYEYRAEDVIPQLLQAMYRWLLFFDAIPSQLVESGKVPDPHDYAEFYAENETDVNPEMRRTVEEAFQTRSFQDRLKNFRSDVLYGMNIDKDLMSDILRKRWNN